MILFCNCKFGLLYSYEKNDFFIKKLDRSFWNVKVYNALMESSVSIEYEQKHFELFQVSAEEEALEVTRENLENLRLKKMWSIRRISREGNVSPFVEGRIKKINLKVHIIIFVFTS